MANNNDEQEAPFNPLLRIRGVAKQLREETGRHVDPRVKAIVLTKLEEAELFCTRLYSSEKL